MRTLATIEKPEITHTQLVRYAGASGDFNPLHTVVTVAEKAGLKDVIAHGMLIMGFAGQALAQWFPRKNLRKFKVRFANMTYPGEKLSIIGKIVEEAEVNGEVLLIGELIVQSAEQVKLTGRFEVLRDN